MKFEVSFATEGPVPASSLRGGQFAVVVTPSGQVPEGAFVVASLNDLVFMTETTTMNYGKTCSTAHAVMVRPVGPGDTITIRG